MLADLYRRSSLANGGDRAALEADPAGWAFEAIGVADGRTRVALDGSAVVGFVTVEVTGRTVELEDLFVEPDRMRQGIARRLVEEEVRRAVRGGARRMAVTANPHALDFYLAVGFVVVGTEETAFGIGYRMARELNR